MTNIVERVLNRARRPLAPPSGPALWLGGTIALSTMYALVFIQTGVLAPFAAIQAAMSNVLPLALLAIAIHALLKAHIMKFDVVTQAGLHLLLAPIFALTWYSLLIVIQGLLRGWVGDGYEFHGFRGPQFTWQVFQGLILYVTITAICYAIRGGRQAANVTIVTTRPLDRFLTRVGEDVIPIDVLDIVSINGAQDYSEVATHDGRRHLVRMSLREFEQRLDPQRFLRIHRSTIIAFSHLSRAEPAGSGRMLAHLSNGETMQVSRAGGQLLRSFMV